MVKRILLGLLGITAIFTAFWAARAEAQSFSRPDCSAFQGKPDGESRCFRKAKLTVRDQNYEALQKNGLEFAYLARPVDGEALEKAYPDVIRAIKDKVEGQFLVRFSVDADGMVSDVRVEEATSPPIQAIARLWADTIAQWKFVKPGKPVTNVPFRRIYLYSMEDDDPRSKPSGG